MEHKIGNELPPINPEQYNAPIQSNEVASSTEFVAEKQANQAMEAAAPQASMANGIQSAVLPQTNDPAAALQTPIIAEDVDLIEKEWVVRAKEIIARTRHDPYEQNRQVEQMKADYMKKRYNRDIKITEDWWLWTPHYQYLLYLSY